MNNKAKRLFYKIIEVTLIYILILEKRKNIFYNSIFKVLNRIKCIIRGYKGNLSK